MIRRHATLRRWQGKKSARYFLWICLASIISYVVHSAAQKKKTLRFIFFRSLALTKSKITMRRWLRSVDCKKQLHSWVVFVHSIFYFLFTDTRWCYGCAIWISKSWSHEEKEKYELWMLEARIIMPHCTGAAFCNFTQYKWTLQSAIGRLGRPEKTLCTNLHSIFYDMAKATI